MEDAADRQRDARVEGPRVIESVESDPFFRLIRLTSATPIPRTPAQMVSDSEVIVRGHLTGVSDGRVVDFKEGASNPMHMAVFAIAVDHVVKGPPLEVVYVEYIRGGVAVASYEEALPHNLPMLFLLRASENFPEAIYKFDFNDRGLPSGESLRTFSRPAGMITETKSGMQYPLADESNEQLFLGGTLMEVEGDLQRLAE
jgi:hypothetical protein